MRKFVSVGTIIHTFIDFGRLLISNIFGFKIKHLVSRTNQKNNQIFDPKGKLWRKTFRTSSSSETSHYLKQNSSFNCLLYNKHILKLHSLRQSLPEHPVFLAFQIVGLPSNFKDLLFHFHLQGLPALPGLLDLFFSTSRFLISDQPHLVTSICQLLTFVRNFLSFCLPWFTSKVRMPIWP